MDTLGEDGAKLPQTHSLEATPSVYVKAATSDNTRRAYQSDLNHYTITYGGVLPATPESIEAYLRYCIETPSEKTGKPHSPRTLVRRVTAIRQYHKLQGLGDPGDSGLVQKTLKGMENMYGLPAEKAAALTLKELDKILALLPADSDDLASARNRALLLTGYCGGFRRSELVSLNWEQIQFKEKGMRILLKKSKTDQTGKGEVIAIPVWPKHRCAVNALLHWQEVSKLRNGPVFRGLTKSGTFRRKAINAGYWARVLKELAIQAGLENAKSVSGHSTRCGATTELARAGASLEAIMRFGRWKCERTAMGYIVAGREFEDSPLNLLFDAAKQL